MATVCIKPCADYNTDNVKQALKDVLEPFKLQTLISIGTRVVIKANLVTAAKPESAAITHPVLLKELCRILVSLGANVVVGDSPGGLYNAAYVSAVYATSGVDTIEETGAKLNRNFNHKHALNPAGAVMKDFEYTSYLDDADVIINFCKLKTHGMMGMSACVKNMFGAVPGVFKPEYHYKYPNHKMFADMLVDLNERFKPALCIVDAVDGMEGNGPTAGTPRHIGALLASDSPYSCDRVCAKLIGLNVNQVETIMSAEKRGLESETTIIGNPDDYIVGDYKLVRQRKEVGFHFKGKLVTKFVQKALCSIPAVRKDECIGCKKCENICPAKAIVMVNKVPVINRDKCIRCFCCQEFCPKGAMKLKRPFIAKILNR